MKEFEEVRHKMLGYPPGATVPLSHREIDVLKAGATRPQAPDLISGYVFGRHFGLEARSGSKLTEEAVIAAAREIRGLRIGDDFRVRCPVVFFDWDKPFDPNERHFITETCENFIYDERMAARVKESH